MKFKRLSLKNFRGFEDVEIELGEQLTVLAGENGAGKSSILDALSVGSMRAIASKTGEHSSPDLPWENVRTGADSASLQIDFDDDARLALHFSRAGLQEESSALFWSSLPPPCIVMDVTRSLLTMAPSTSRTVSRASKTTRYPEYEDALNTKFTSFERLEEWFRTQEDLENQERVRLRDFTYADAGLEATRAAFAAVVPGLSDPRIDRARPTTGSQLVVTKNGGELSAAQLSHGERSLLVMAATIARRLSKIPPERAQEGALVLIDEIELHLHPRWQRTVIPSLLKAFPRCQFVVSTHSPQVLSSVERESVVLLDNFRAYRPAAGTEGRDSNAILSEVMGVTAHPESTEVALRKISDLIDEEKYAAARAAVDDLSRELGDRDHEVVRLRSLLTFVDGE